MKTFQEFEQDVFFCRKNCPLRSYEPGFFPKYGGCNENGPIVAIVSENPSNKPRASQIAAGSPGKPLRISKEEVAEYFGDKKSGKLIDVISALGLTLDKIYYTSAYKCASRNASRNEVEEARKLCKGHLGDELSIVGAPVVVTLGKPAFESVYEVMSNSPPPSIRIKSLSNRNTFNFGNIWLVALPHGAGLWRKPTVSVTAFQKWAIELLKPILDQVRQR